MEALELPCPLNSPEKKTTTKNNDYNTAGKLTVGLIGIGYIVS